MVFTRRVEQRPRRESNLRAQRVDAYPCVGSVRLGREYGQWGRSIVLTPSVGKWGLRGSHRRNSR